LPLVDKTSLLWLGERRETSTLKMSSMFRIMWTTVVACYMWQLVDVVEAFQVGTTTTTTGIPRHWHAPKIAATGVNALQPYAASLFAGHISEQQYQRRRRQHRQQKSPRLWQAKADVDDNNNKANTTLAVKLRKFIMSLFRLLMAPLVSNALWVAFL
jgi:hypothetical protein